MRAVVRLIVAVTLFFGPLQSGARYFYCESLGLLASDPCATAERKASDCPLQSLERVPVDCCERITLPTTPEGARADEHTIPPTYLVAIVAATEYRGEGSRIDPGRRFEGERLRRPPRPPEQRRAQLMVFLT
jgi:hypothetical protein